MAENQPNVLITRSPKSQGIGLILTFIFGPLGLFYSTIIGAVIMLLVSFVLVFVTLGIAWIIIVPVCMIWSAIAVSSYNKKLMSGKI